jgi:hypothetical protein
MTLLYKLLIKQILTKIVLRYVPLLTVPLDSVQDNLEQFCQGPHRVTVVFVFTLFTFLFRLYVTNAKMYSRW